MRLSRICEVSNTSDTEENPQFRYKKAEIVKTGDTYTIYCKNIKKISMHQHILTQTRSQNDHLLICLPNIQSFASHILIEPGCRPL